MDADGTIVGFPYRIITGQALCPQMDADGTIVGFPYRIITGQALCPQMDADGTIVGFPYRIITGQALCPPAGRMVLWFVGARHASSRHAVEPRSRRFLLLILFFITG